MNQRSLFLEKLIPFLVLGIGIALFVALLILMSYVLIWGIIIGAVLWLVATIKNKFFPSKSTKSKHQGITIEYDEFK